MLLNHVLSGDAKSGIFAAIFDYFREFAPASWSVEVSLRPRADAHVVHYHRPQLERRLKPRRAVVTVHHDLNDIDPTLQLDVFLARYREAAGVVCLNLGQAARLKRAGLTALTTIPHGYNERVLSLRDEGSFTRGQVRLGFISKHYWRRFKGEAYLQDLAKRLSPALFSFVLVGEGREQTAAGLRQLGFAVRCYEYLPYALFQSLYASIDYLLMCSNFEGGPANLPEAIATGTPVIATPVGMVPDFIRDRENGLLLSGELELDAARIRGLAEPGNPLGEQLRHGARASAARVPTWREVVRRHFELYERVARGEPLDA